MTLTIRVFGRELFALEVTPDEPETIYASEEHDG